MASPSVWYGVKRHKQNTTLSKLYCTCKLQFKDLKLDIGSYRSSRKKLPRLPVIIILNYASLTKTQAGLNLEQALLRAAGLRQRFDIAHRLLLKELPENV